MQDMKNIFGQHLRQTVTKAVEGAGAQKQEDSKQLVAEQSGSEAHLVRQEQSPSPGA